MISKLYRDNVTADELSPSSIRILRGQIHNRPIALYCISLLLAGPNLGLIFPDLFFPLTFLSEILVLAVLVLAIRFCKGDSIVILRGRAKRRLRAAKRRRRKYKIIRGIFAFVASLVCAPFLAIPILPLLFLYFYAPAIIIALLSSLPLIVATLAATNNTDWIPSINVVTEKELDAVRKLSPDKFEDVSKLVDFFVMTGDYEEADHYSRQLLSMAQTLPVIADNAENRELCA